MKGNKLNVAIVIRSCKTGFKSFKTTSELSDIISKDLQEKGMKFVGTTIIYSYLQAIGIINDHEKQCFKHAGKKLCNERE